MSAKPSGDKRKKTPESAPGAVWFRAEKTSRTRPQLSHERIIATAVELLDRDGVQKLSMRRLAERLGAHATSLYWHVATKEDVLDLALDAVFAELDLPDEHSASWQGDVEAFMTGLRSVLLRHPWAAALAGSRPLLGPHALGSSEFAYTALATGGFDGVHLSSAAATITHYVIGSASSEAVWRKRSDEAATRSAMDAHLRAHIDEYPTLAGHFPLLEEDDWDAHFHRGMRLLLTGLTSSEARG
ncbi:TetR/AcrR family transcriptional regulator C-terminal domain-containing protein [Streptomyces sp. RKCA744]|uniref:TetR/AcrR family transcriptional regulator C-terminal domain-containing protein n=1 Tax=Streptomyces sp. RKCA744 TaxID=2959340 RepID=UPI00209E01D8|nr:TetR/AcrR family transcriptional regulator C-terminal domain-containing protein [Streptomyces sp. RKCA744]MCO8308423.1 TetR/AcrR family transcriptional regulator C-terminal domain-containing protein [Streptomyces sp. RKCA744]